LDHSHTKQTSLSRYLWNTNLGVNMAAGAENGDGPQLSELESLQLKANKITDESLESTRRMINLCEESQSAGIKTLEMLEHQGEQLDRVEEGLDGMHSEMKTAEKHLTGMEKWCGLCVCPWNRTSRVRDTDGTWKNPLRKDSNAGNVVNSQPKGSAVPDAARGGPYIQRINDDAREDEMEDNMQAVGSVLGNLKSMAADMGDEISRQNKQLERIDRKAEGVDLQIGSANKRTEKLLK